MLNEFELALNPTKTAIVELPDNFDAEWASRIRIFVFRDAGLTGQRNDLTAYFDMVFEFFKRFPEEGLLNTLLHGCAVKRFGAKTGRFLRIF